MCVSVVLCVHSSGKSYLFAANSFDVPAYREWFLSLPSSAMAGVYAYQRRILQLLQWRKRQLRLRLRRRAGDHRRASPRADDEEAQKQPRWLLKSPGNASLSFCEPSSLTNDLLI